MLPSAAQIASAVENTALFAVWNDEYRFGDWQDETV
jgi:hypothetical protein